MSYWKSAGLSFNKYTAIAARTARRALKEDKRIAAEKRDFVDVRATKWSQGDAKSITHLGTGQDLTEEKI